MRRRARSQDIPAAPGAGAYWRTIGVLWAFKLALAFALALTFDVARGAGPPDDLIAWLWTVSRAAIIRVGPEAMAQVQTVIRYLETRATELAPAELVQAAYRRDGETVKTETDAVGSPRHPSRPPPGPARPLANDGGSYS